MTRRNSVIFFAGILALVSSLAARGSEPAGVTQHKITPPQTGSVEVTSTLPETDKPAGNTRWTENEAQQWSRETGWLCGTNFNPSTAINQLEMWQEDSFDPDTIDRELGWAQDLGMNVMRVYLHHLAWKVNKAGFKERVNTYLKISSKHGIKTIFVFFDDCWNPSYAAGKQPEPKPGVHNSGWVRDPGDLLFTDPSLVQTLEAYVKDVLTTFKDDKRIVMWDLYNEPGNSDYNNRSLPLLRKVFEWGWSVRPSQPMSSAAYNGKENDKIEDIRKFQLESSDIITYHNYDGPEQHQQVIDSLRIHNRPMVCTEYLARKYNSRFANITPMLRKQNIGAINWGLVTGRTNTKYTWGEVVSDGSEPPLWLHDILYSDGRPYSQEEVDTIKRLNGK